MLGGGLAGVSAANTVLECGGNVVLLDKSSFCGGNSTKATSGINGANTRSQRMKGVFDSNEIFTADTLRGGAKKPDLVKAPGRPGSLSKRSGWSKIFVGKGSLAAFCVQLLAPRGPRRLFYRCFARTPARMWSG